MQPPGTFEVINNIGNGVEWAYTWSGMGIYFLCRFVYILQLNKQFN